MGITRPILAALNYVASAILFCVGALLAFGILFFATGFSLDLLLPLPSLLGVAVGISNGVLLVCLDQAGPRMRASIAAASLANAVLLIALVAYSTSTQAVSGSDIHAAWICSAVIFGVTSIFVWAQPKLRQANVCSQCGYDITGLNVCPECGTNRPA